jgi:ATP-binding cassette, sub-family E, member 1
MIYPSWIISPTSFAVSTANRPCTASSQCLPLSEKVSHCFTAVLLHDHDVPAGINIFLDGFVPTENLRFREESLTFKMSETADELIVDKTRHYSYPSMTKTLGAFKLTVEAGSFTDSEIIVMLGENGTGKTTFVRLLAGVETPDVETDKLSLSVSLKPQTISPKFPGTVRMLLLKQIKHAFMHPQFQTDVLKPMSLENLMDQDVKTLSGGELQRVAIVLALGTRHLILCVKSC